MSEGYRLDKPFSMSSPECAGAMRPEGEGGLLQYRCHIGHVLSAEAMCHAQLLSLEHRLGSCLSMLNERAELCRRMIEAARAQGRPHAALDAALAESLERADAIRSLLESDWTIPETKMEIARRA